MAKRRKALGKVDLFGLNILGKPGMHALVGAGIGGGAAALTTFLAERSKSVKIMANSDAIGFGVGLATAAAMYPKRSTRHAAYGAAVGAFFAAGLPWIKRMWSSAPQAAAVAPTPAADATATQVKGIAGLGIHQLRNLNGLGIHQATQLNGLGVHNISPVTKPAGVAGTTLGKGPPVNLYGHQTAGMKQARLMGAPGMSGLAASYGATLFGGRS